MGLVLNETKLQVDKKRSHVAKFKNQLKILQTNVFRSCKNHKLSTTKHRFTCKSFGSQWDLSLMRLNHKTTKYQRIQAKLQNFKTFLKSVEALKTISY